MIWRSCRNQAPGYVTAEFLGQYEEALGRKDPAAAKKILDAAAPAMRKGFEEHSLKILDEKLKPLKEQLAKDEETVRDVRTKDQAIRMEIKAAREALAEAVARRRAAKTEEAREQARKDVAAAHEKLDASNEKLEKVATISEAEKDVARTKQAMEDVRLRFDPKSRAPLPCFPPNLVRTPLGDCRIDKIKTGDPVLAYDFATQRLVERQVLQVFRNSTEHFFQYRLVE